MTIFQEQQEPRTTVINRRNLKKKSKAINNVAKGSKKTKKDHEDVIQKKLNCQKGNRQPTLVIKPKQDKPINIW